MKISLRSLLNILLLSISIQANAQFLIPVTWTGGSGNTYGQLVHNCGQNQITFTADSIPAGLTYRWVRGGYLGNLCSFTAGFVVVLSTGSAVFNYDSSAMIFCEAVDALNQVQGHSQPIVISNLDLNDGICATPFGTGPSFICAGDSVGLAPQEGGPWSDSQSNPWTLQWQLNGVDIPGANSLNYWAKTAGNYRLEFTRSCGSGYSNVIVVNNLSTPPTPVISGVNTFCAGSSTTICASGSPAPSCYLWSTGSTNTCIHPSNSGVYTVTVCDANGCTASATVTLTELPNPVVQISATDSALCLNQSAILDAGGPFSSYLWNTGNTTQYHTIAGPGVYTVTVTDSNGCTGTDLITVQAEPPYSTVLSASGSLNICLGDSVQLSAPPSLVSYQWHRNNNIIPGATSSSYWVKNTGRYSCESVDQSGCLGISDTLRVRIVCLPPPDENERNSGTFTIESNPSSDYININLDNPVSSKATEYFIYDLTGKLIMDGLLMEHDNNLDISNLKAGVYLLVILGDNNVQSSKLIKY